MFSKCKITFFFFTNNIIISNCWITYKRLDYISLFFSNIYNFSLTCSLLYCNIYILTAILKKGYIITFFKKTWKNHATTSNMQTVLNALYARSNKSRLERTAADLNTITTTTSCPLHHFYTLPILHNAFSWLTSTAPAARPTTIECKWRRPATPSMLCFPLPNISFIFPCCQNIQIKITFHFYSI